jgi:hypothetical protein
LREAGKQKFTTNCRQGPARRDLPAFATSTDENGQLLVKLPMM